MSKTEKVKQYIKDNPEAGAAEVAKKFKISVPYVYVIRSQMKKAATKAKKIIVSAQPEVKVNKPITLEQMKIEMFDKPHDPVNNPAHYTDGGIETIDFIEAKRLGYHLGNVIKYISRASKKGTDTGIEDLRKAQWYLARAIERNEINVSR